MPKNIRQTVKFSVSPKEVYEALMDSKKHAAFTKWRGFKVAVYSNRRAG